MTPPHTLLLASPGLDTPLATGTREHDVAGRSVVATDTSGGSRQRLSWMTRTRTVVDSDSRSMTRFRCRCRVVTRTRTRVDAAPSCREWWQSGLWHAHTRRRRRQERGLRL